MSKTYNLSNRSDMQRFERDMNDLVKKKAENVVSTRIFTVKCPFCSNEIHSAPGKVRCMKCGKIVDLKVNVKI